MAEDWYVSAISVDPSRVRLDFIDLRVDEDAALAASGVFPLDVDEKRLPAILVAPDAPPIRTEARLRHQPSRGRRTRLWIAELPEFVRQYGGDLEMIFPVHGRIVIAPQFVEAVQALRELGAEVRPTPPITLVKGAQFTVEGVNLEERTNAAPRSTARRSPRDQVLGFAANNGFEWAVRELKERDARFGDVGSFEAARGHLCDALTTEAAVLRSTSRASEELRVAFPEIQAVYLHVEDDEEEQLVSDGELEQLAGAVERAARILTQDIGGDADA